ncbi:zinc ribbon domain-containing protein [Salicibibacter cibi]|nr:hypothetical protein [Salicibibacter cibi]
MLVSAGVLLAAFITYQITASIFDQHRAVDQFEEALTEGDTEQLAAMVTSSDPGMEMESDDFQGLVQYMEGNASFVNEEISSLRQQAEYMDHEDEEFAANSADNSLFQLNSDSNNWNIFDAYSFEVPPFYINITTNEADTAIYLDEEEIAVADQDDFSQEIGPIAPGQYTVKAELDHDYVTLEEEEELNLIEAPQDQIQVDLNLDGEYIHIDSNEPEADVYVNGDALDMTVEELDSELGPVVTDGSMTIHAEHDYPWGSASSEEEEITGTNVSLEIPTVSEELKDQLMDMVNENVDTWADAYQNLDEDQYVQVTDQYIDSMNEEFDRMDDADNSWDGELQDIVYDLDSFSMNDNEDQYTTTFDANVHYESDGSDEETDLQFTAVYDTDSEEWLLDDHSASASLSFGTPSNSEAFTVDGSEDSEEESSETVDESELEEFLYDVNEASVESINEQDFSLVEGLMTSDGPRAQEHEDYIDYLAEENITQTHVETSLESVDAVSEEEWEVTSIEVFDIHSDDGTETTEFRTVTTVMLEDDEFKVHELQSTDEL